MTAPNLRLYFGGTSRQQNGSHTFRIEVPIATARSMAPNIVPGSPLQSLPAGSEVLFAGALRSAADRVANAVVKPVQEFGGGANTQRRLLSGRRQIHSLPSGLGAASL
jgi:hypothetical protein